MTAATRLDLEGLQKAVEQRSTWLIHLHLTADPRLHPLRGDARFDDLARRITPAL